ncbi:MAG: HDOD domain-containing protein [Calditrichaeota bacterium]|nr:HDOD domain-containing protein [Calditrichota bacterium]
MKRSIINIIEEAEDFPSLSIVAIRLNQLVSDPDVSLHAIGSMIENDAAMVTRVLKNVNSGYYKLSSQVTNIHQAVSLLGLKTIRNIIYSVSLLDTFTHTNNEQYANLFIRSICAGVAGDLLSEVTHQKNRSEIYLSSLLQNLGKFVFMFYLNREYINLLDEARDRAIDMFVLEKNYLKIHNGQAGTIIAEKWNLPKVVTLAIRYQYNINIIFKKTFSPEEAEIIKHAYLAGLAADIFLDWNKASRIAQFRKAYDVLVGEHNKTKADDILAAIPQLVNNLSSGFSLINIKIPELSEIFKIADEELIHSKSIYNRTYTELVASNAELKKIRNEFTLTDLHHN